MPKDISKKTVAILIVVAVILSVTSTLLAMAREPVIKEADNPTAGAEVKVLISEKPVPVQEGAQVSVNVKEKE